MYLQLAILHVFQVPRDKHYQFQLKICLVIQIINFKMSRLSRYMLKKYCSDSFHCDLPTLPGGNHIIVTACK